MDVGELLDWAEAEAGQRTYVLYACVSAGGLGLLKGFRDTIRTITRLPPRAALSALVLGEAEGYAQTAERADGLRELGLEQAGGRALLGSGCRSLAFGMCPREPRCWTSG